MNPEPARRELNYSTPAPLQTYIKKSQHRATALLALPAHKASRASFAPRRMLLLACVHRGTWPPPEARTVRDSVGGSASCTRALNVHRAMWSVQRATFREASAK